MPEDARGHFATVYITVASVLLGIALEDLVGIVRDLIDAGRSEE